MLVCLIGVHESKVDGVKLEINVVDVSCFST